MMVAREMAGDSMPDNELVSLLVPLDSHTWIEPWPRPSLQMEVHGSITVTAYSKAYAEQFH